MRCSAKDSCMAGVEGASSPSPWPNSPVVGIEVGDEVVACARALARHAVRCDVAATVLVSAHSHSPDGAKSAACTSRSDEELDCEEAYLRQLCAAS